MKSNTRLEILKDGILIPLILDEQEDISYNAVLNRIGKVDTREISGSNTFPIPWVHQNIQALDLNIFNVQNLAAGLNRKYEAIYYKDDIVFKKGFVVINNMNNGDININFISEALLITSKWASTTYKELIDDPSLPRSAEMTAAITEMVDYTMPFNSIATSLTDITGESFPVALFPNNLNQIGDKWQIFDDGTRVDNAFNPYQSRPVFNAKAFMILACESYDFTPVFDTSIDWSIIDKTYMVSNGLDKNQYNDIEFSQTSHASTESITTSQFLRFTGDWDIIGLAKFPVEVQGSGTPPEFYFLPNLVNGNVGQMDFKLYPPSGGDARTPVATSYWTDGLGGEIPQVLTQTGTFSDNTLVINKTELNTIPVGGFDFIGIKLECTFFGYSTQGDRTFEVQVTESFVPDGLVAYDEHAQYLTASIDLTYAAPLETISSLMNGLMQKQGILMDVDSTNKEVTFFSYGKYPVQRDAKVFKDWSNYLLEYSNPKFNTDYGNKYGILNKIGLSSPYPGNWSSIIFGNQFLHRSKFNEYAENTVKQFKDVVNVQKVEHNIADQYTEYETKGASLVALDDIVIAGLVQTRFNQAEFTGTITELAPIFNVNYFVTPDGVVDWYNLIDNAVKCEPSFLLPEDEIRNLDLKVPIFISQLGGYYIIEEVKEYVDSSTIVKVKLIKLPAPSTLLQEDDYTTPGVYVDTSYDSLAVSYGFTII